MTDNFKVNTLLFSVRENREKYFGSVIGIK